MIIRALLSGGFWGCQTPEYSHCPISPILGKGTCNIYAGSAKNICVVPTKKQYLFLSCIQSKRSMLSTPMLYNVYTKCMMNSNYQPAKQYFWPSGTGTWSTKLPFWNALKTSARSGLKTAGISKSGNPRPPLPGRNQKQRFLTERDRKKGITEE